MDLGLYDYLMIAVYGIAFVLVVLAGMGIVAAWPVIAQFGRASFQRFFVFEWSGLPDRIADMSSISNTAADDYVAEPVRMAQTDSRQADRQPVSEPHKAPAHLQLNKTRTAVIEELLTHGWNVGEIRSVVKGDNGDHKLELDAA